MHIILSKAFWTCAMWPERGLFFSIFLSIIQKVSLTRVQKLVVGGSLATINEYPHSAYLNLQCDDENRVKNSWKCGSGILNQRILITAAHCMCKCIYNTNIIIIVGSENRDNGIMRSGSGYIINANFDEDSFDSDIALIKMSIPVKFDDRVKRVAIMDRPPYSEMAYVAGWGIIDGKKTITPNLKFVQQKVWKHETCVNMFEEMPRGTICASSPGRGEFPARGDSGSALLVRGYIQIGVVSYKSPLVDENVIIYTDVGYYYKWIAYNAESLFCSTETLSNHTISRS